MPGFILILSFLPSLLSLSSDVTENVPPKTPLGNITGPVWCYCNTCPENIKYCKVDKGGYCYKERLTESYDLYGCWNRREAEINCNPTPNTFMDELSYTIGPRIMCCGIHWCTVTTEFLKENMKYLVDVEEENVKDKKTCLCSECQATSMVCRTHGVCYRDLIRYGNAQYGCISKERSEEYCDIKMDRIRNNFFNPMVQCCGKDKSLCNYNVNPRNLRAIYPALRIHSLRLERLGIVNNIAHYSLVARNSIQDDMSVTISNLLTLQEPVLSVTNNGSTDFWPVLNRLYKLEIHPFFKQYSLYTLSRTFYFARIFAFSSSWFPSNLDYDTKITSVMICKICREMTTNFNCSQCISHTEPDNNPIYITDEYS